jgi:hypothetical protein
MHCTDGSERPVLAQTDLHQTLLPNSGRPTLRLHPTFVRSSTAGGTWSRGAQLTAYGDLLVNVEDVGIATLVEVQRS